MFLVFSRRLIKEQSSKVAHYKYPGTNLKRPRLRPNPRRKKLKTRTARYERSHIFTHLATLRAEDGESRIFNQQEF